MTRVTFALQLLAALAWTYSWTCANGSPLPVANPAGTTPAVTYKLQWNNTSNCCDIIASDGTYYWCGAGDTPKDECP